MTIPGGESLTKKKRKAPGSWVMRGKGDLCRGSRWGPRPWGRRDLQSRNRVSRKDSAFSFWTV